MTKRLTVLHVIASFQIGGAERMAASILSGLNRAHFKPLLCGLGGSGPLLDMMAERDIACFVLNRRQGKDLSLPSKIHRLLNEQRVDVVQTHHFSSLLYAVGPARLLRLPIVHTEHSYHSLRDNRRLRWLARLTMPLARELIVVGDDVGRFLVSRIGISPERLQVIHQGVRCSDTNRSEVGRIRTELGLGHEAPVVGHVARLTAVKDQDLLLRAMQKVLQVRPDACLVLVGDGELRLRLEALSADLGIARSVRFLGFRADAEQLLHAFDLMVLSSHTEGLPIALLEGMAAGRPVVATAVGCIPELLADGRGVLVPSRAPDRLADAILMLLADGPARARHAEAGRRHVAARFSLPEMIARYESLYRRTADRPRHIAI
jgi:glycosyltransferase involved in cell wall biosynthesis